MHILILSDLINDNQRFGKSKYVPPWDIQLDVGNPNDESINFSIFDYDVSVIHITSSAPHTIGYFHNFPKIFQDARIALQNGRTVICLPQSDDFRSSRLSEYGMTAYEWIRKLGVSVQDNIGINIKAAGAGQAEVIQQYLRVAPRYYQIVTSPLSFPQEVLALVDDTEIVVGCQYTAGLGFLVILPPPSFEDYQLSMFRLIDVARRYYDRAQQMVPPGDVPKWIDDHLTKHAKGLQDDIVRLSTEKEKYDRIIYSLYGTGEDLEKSVAFLLEDLGLTVTRMSKGANIDLKAKYVKEGIGFAIEVTGPKGAVQKDGTKIPQAWQYLTERAGTPEETDRLIIIANTQYNLDPRDRKPESFSPPVVSLLTKHDVLLITALQLYDLWKGVQEGTRKAEDVIRTLHKSTGLFKP